MAQPDPESDQSKKTLEVGFSAFQVSKGDKELEVASEASPGKKRVALRFFSPFFRLLAMVRLEN